MVKYLASNSNVRFQRAKGCADHYPERPRGMADGRAIEASPFNGVKLGGDFDQLRPMRLEALAGLAFSIGEYNKLGFIAKQMASLLPG